MISWRKELAKSPLLAGHLTTISCPKQQSQLALYLLRQMCNFTSCHPDLKLCEYGILNRGLLFCFKNSIKCIHFYKTYVQLDHYIVFKKAYIMIFVWIFHKTLEYDTLSKQQSKKHLENKSTKAILYVITINLKFWS